MKLGRVVQHLIERSTSKHSFGNAVRFRQTFDDIRPKVRFSIGPLVSGTNEISEDFSFLVLGHGEQSGRQRIMFRLITLIP